MRAGSANRLETADLTCAGLSWDVVEGERPSGLLDRADLPLFVVDTNSVTKRQRIPKCYLSVAGVCGVA